MPNLDDASYADDNTPLFTNRSTKKVTADLKKYIEFYKNSF